MDHCTALAIMITAALISVPLPGRGCSRYSSGSGEDRGSKDDEETLMILILWVGYILQYSNYATTPKKENTHAGMCLLNSA